MSAIEWDEKKYGTGNNLIDEQHKKLVELINGLIEACSLGKGKEEIGKVLSFLENYVVTHFKDEEELMDRVACPARAENKASHDRFIQEYENFKKTYEEEGAKLSLVIKLQKTICDWFIAHVCKVDCQLRKCPDAQDKK